jgi:hypothetical protein
VRIGAGCVVRRIGDEMSDRGEEIRLILGMAGVVAVTAIVLLTPLLSDLLAQVRF